MSGSRVPKRLSVDRSGTQRDKQESRDQHEQFRADDDKAARQPLPERGRILRL